MCIIRLIAVLIMMILGHLIYHGIVTKCGVRNGRCLCGMRGYDPNALHARQVGEDYDGYSNISLSVPDHHDGEEHEG